MFVLLGLICTACLTEAISMETVTATPLTIITSTLPPTQTPRPSQTSAPASATPIMTPAEGQTTSKLNVRDRPAAGSDLLGTVQIFDKVQIVGQDPTSSWWMIVYPESPSGLGWITAEFVQVTDTSAVPVISEPTPKLENKPTLELGSTQTGSTSVPEASIAPTLVLATAYPDGDSAQSPGVSVVLSPSSLKSFNFSSDISSPEGDAEDWVQFKLDGVVGQQTNVLVILDCSGSSNLNIELIQNNVVLQAWDNISCGQRSQLQLGLYAGAPYSLRLLPVQGISPLNYVAFTVIVQLL